MFKKALRKIKQVPRYFTFPKWIEWAKIFLKDILKVTPIEFANKIWGVTKQTQSQVDRLAGKCAQREEKNRNHRLMIRKLYEYFNLELEFDEEKIDVQGVENDVPVPVVKRKETKGVQPEVTNTFQENLEQLPEIIKVYEYDKQGVEQSTEMHLKIRKVGGKWAIEYKELLQSDGKIFRMQNSKMKDSVADMLRFIENDEKVDVVD